MTKSYFSSIILGISVLFLLSFSSASFAAVGCTLNDPDRDVKRIFPESTGYRTEFITIEERGGEKLQKEIEEKLGEELDPIYEGIDTPYAYYTILKGKEVIGRVHGINQKGMYGGMQIILATDLEGKIIDLYYQKLWSPEGPKFRNEDFTEKFIGMDLDDFFNEDTLKTIEDPSEDSAEDFNATLRGIKKNLILLDIFWGGDKK
ncbi:MAG: hypothetical protein KKD11_02055 [Candidatus Omnitrophica bacterium]|nr:hypothetical protein [Candidatus Omnitrophota bacterium]